MHVYCLFCQTQRCRVIAELLEIRGIDRAFAPRIIRKHRKQGVNVEKTYFLTMLNMSLLAAVAGILFVGRSTAAGPSDGTGWEMDAIASVYIGGAAVSGGVGTIMATMVGGMMMAVLNSGLMLLGVGADKTQVIKGLVLMAAVAFDVYNKRPGHVSITKRLFGMNSAENKEGTPAEKKS